MMNLLGYRAIGKEYHKNLFKFLKKMDIDRNLINNFIYRDAEKVSKEEAEEIVEKRKRLFLKLEHLFEKKEYKKIQKEVNS
jgi:hypothetical protein